MIERKTLWMASGLFVSVVACGVYMVGLSSDNADRAHAASGPKKNDNAKNAVSSASSSASDTDGASVQEISYGDWLLRIETPPKTKDGETPESVAYLFERIINEQGQQLASISIFPPAEKGKKATVFVNMPLGVFLPVGAALKVGKDGKAEKDARQLPAVFQTCLGNLGCQAAAELDEEMVKDMSKAETLFVGALALNQQQIALPFSLQSFGKAYDALMKHKKFV